MSHLRADALTLEQRMSASICTIYSITLLSLTFSSSSSVLTELPSAGTPFTICWLPGRRRCHPWRGTRAAQLCWHCTWQSRGSRCLPALSGLVQRPRLRSASELLKRFLKDSSQDRLWDCEDLKNRKHAVLESSHLLPPCLNVSLSLTVLRVLSVRGSMGILLLNQAKSPLKML